MQIARLHLQSFPCSESGMRPRIPISKTSVDDEGAAGPEATI